MRPSPRRPAPRPALVVIASSLGLMMATIATMTTMACTEGEQQSPAPAPGSHPTTSAIAQPKAQQTIDLPTSAAPSDAPSAPPSMEDAAGVDATLALHEQDGAPLGQTDAFPSVSTAAHADRIKRLWDAIVSDDPELAKPAFFPLVAYAQVKAIPKPAIDYERRLLAAYARDIHAYHKKLGKDAAAATFVRLDVPEAKAKWMEPGSEGNKLGYDRVLDSKLVLKRDDGTEVTLDVKSMISWRGEWYVVHLAGFK